MGMGLVVTVVRESMTSRVSNPMLIQQVDDYSRLKLCYYWIVIPRSRCSQVGQVVAAAVVADMVYTAAAVAVADKVID